MGRAATWWVWLCAAGSNSTLRQLLSELLAVFAAMVAGDLVNATSQLGGAGASMFWPGNGVLMGTLLVCRPTRIVPYAVTGLVAQITWSTIAGTPSTVMAVSCLTKVPTILVAALLLRRRMGRSTDIARSGILPAFAVIGVLASSALPSFLIALVRNPTFDLPLLAVFMRAFMANAMGVIVITPLVVCWYRQEVRVLFDRARLRETSWVLVGFILVTVGIFGQSEYPLLFMVFPALLVAIARLGFAGAAIMSPILTLIVICFTLSGRGPLFLIATPTPVLQLLTQIFLMTAAATALAVGNIVAERRRLDMGIAVRETRARFAEAKLRKSESLHRLMSENASDMVSRFALDGRRLYVSPSMVEILGLAEHEVLDLNWINHVHPDDIAIFDALKKSMRNGDERIAALCRLGRADGTWVWFEARLRLVRDSLGEPLEYISNARDVTAQKEAEQALADAMRALSVLATTDALTGIANRRRFDETLHREWRRAMRSGEPVALLMIDADNFKHYNDVYGHHEGDACLRAIAMVLTAHTRRPNDFAARYGGEEFVLILPATDGSGAFEIASRVVDAVQALGLPHVHNPGRVVTVSVGVAAMTPQRDSPMSVLIEAADDAMYQAKRGGRNRAELRQAEGEANCPVDELHRHSARAGAPL